MIRRSTSLCVLFAVGLALLIAACNGEADPPLPLNDQPRPTATEAAPLTAAVLMDDGRERERVTAALDDAGYERTDSIADAEVAFADRSIDGGDAVVIDAWIAVTDQRRDVLELTRDDVRAILQGNVDDWSQLGGSARPLTLHLPEEDAERIASAFDLGDLDQRNDVTRLPHAELVETVEGHPGAFGLIAAPELRPGVLALIVDGHDPLRDAERDSPLRLERWVRAENRELDAALRAVGWPSRSLDFHPVSFLATGDIIPVRCTYAELRERGYGAMFDGTRELLQAADIVLSPLDAGLTDRRPPTPCADVRPIVLSAPTGIADAIAQAGVDVVALAVNHHLDCYGGCPREDVHRDTTGAIEAAGMLHAGAGENLEAARQPVFLEQDGIRFGFLAYDAIAPHWFATPELPGTAPLTWDTLDDLANDVASAKEQADHVIVAFSWSYAEYVTMPDELQRAAAHVVAQAGGSLIVGNHPHIVQASEVIGDTFVIYALGNYIFDQDWSEPPGRFGHSNYETVDNLIMETGFTRERLVGYRLRPAMVRENHRPELVDPAGEDGQRIFQRLWDATDALPPWGGGGVGE